MKRLLLLIILSLPGITLTAQQDKWTKAQETRIDLTNFKLSGKVVRAKYGKAIMYFNQADYLKQIVKEDTVVITPKYFSQTTMAELLNKGRVKIVRRSDNAIETEIFHRLKVNGTMWEYELHDSVGFFISFDEIRTPGPIIIAPFDSLQQKKKAVIQKNDFAYVEEFPNARDSNTIKIKDYFPVKPLFHYVYKNNEGYDELDTNICKQVILNKKDVFYFAECYNPFGIVSIGTTMFGQGLYFYKNDSLFSLEADFEKDIRGKELSASSLLLPAFMKPGDSVVYSKWYGDEKMVITLLQKEDLQIGTVAHSDCIQLKIKEYWPESVYLGYVWLKKNFGLVKWMRNTGRIDELVNSF